MYQAPFSPPPQKGPGYKASAARTPPPHYIILRVVLYAHCTNNVCIERTLVTVDYEDKRKNQCTAPDKMLLFRVKIRFSTHVDLQL